MNKKENRIETWFGVLVVILSILSVVLYHLGKRSVDLDMVVYGLCGFALLSVVCSMYCFWRKHFFRAILFLIMICIFIVNVVKYKM